MCGRYASFRQAQDLADIFDVSVVADEAADVPPSWNVAPTDGVRVVLERSVPAAEDAPQPEEVGAVRRELHVARWGLVPHWAKDLSVGARMINARVESVAKKSAFATPLRTKRCIVPADGYYEWQKPDPAAGGGTKTPYFIRTEDSSPLAFAGLYAWWRDPARHDEADAAPWLLTCTILTTAAAGPMTELHDRVPVVLRPDAVDHWLDRSVTNADEALAALSEPAPRLAWHEVSTTVNSVRNNGPQLIEPAS
ncbi:SOS response-associated peptidase [Georgenia subflava]|uniref:Abasic site processing protein n=1 Tax=Georgenia subflava TaxID=1622177 RepID=A0A6N7EQ62_9MICO|nr:SOS response-associated peptidase [Georgenia subflava]MPV38276.1 SOS response-associated peptidase [Georgenia subflava]